MKQLIKAFRSYRMELPAPEALEAHLATKPHVELTSLDAYGAGFVPVQGDLVKKTFGDTFAFAVRYDEKVLPGSVVRAATAKRVLQIEENEGRRVGRKERREIADGERTILLGQAFVRTTVLTCHYNQTAKLLIVPTASKKMADIATSTLLKVVGSIKATTIYVSTAKHGLTTRLQNHLDIGEGFEDFAVGGKCVLQSINGKTSVDLLDLDYAADGLREALATGAEVKEIALSGNGVTFRLGSDFVVKGVQLLEPPEADDDSDLEYQWRQQAAFEMQVATKTVEALCEMLGYKD